MIRLFAVVGSIQALTVLFTLGRAKIIALMVGPEGVGVIGIVDQVVQSLSYASALSLPFASLRYLSRAHSSSAEDFQRCFSAFFKGLFAISLGASVLAAICIAIQPELLGPELIRYRPFLLVALFTLPLMMLGGLLNNALAAAERPNTAALFLGVTAAAYMFSAFVGLSLGGVAGFYWANLVIGAALLLGASVFIKRALNIRLFVPDAGVLQEIRRSPEIVAFALMMFVTSVTHSVSLLATRYVTLRELGEVGAGILHSQLAIALAIGALLSQVNGLFLTPKVNRHISVAEKFRLTDQYLGALVWVVAIAVICTASFPDLLVSLLFSREFLAGASLLVYFVAAQGLLQVAGVFQALMIGLNDMRAYVVMAVGGHTVLAATVWILTPALGLKAAAIAFCASAVLLTLLTYVRLAYAHGYRCSGGVLKMIAYAMFSGTVGAAAAKLLPVASVSTVLVRLAVLSMLVGGSLLFLSPEARAELKNTLRVR
jgi:PST family polysaccharide transporter